MKNLEFVITLDVGEKYFNKEELNQLEMLLERTVNQWDSDLAKKMNVTSKKLLKFWDKGCFANVNLK